MWTMKRKNNGFTLIEVLLALVITSMAVSIVSQGFRQGGYASLVSEHRTRAAWLAQMTLTDVETGEIAVNRGAQTTEYENDPEYSYTVDSDTSDVEGLYEVTVTVTWTERGRDQSFILTRLLFRPEES